MKVYEGDGGCGGGGDVVVFAGRCGNNTAAELVVRTVDN